MLFNKQSDEKRIDEVQTTIYKLWNGWLPYQTNAFDLKKEAGNDWTKIDISKLTVKSWNDSWKNMPKEALAYIQSLSEFDAVLFKEITGLDVNGKKETIKIGNHSYDKQEVEKRLEGLKALDN